MSMKNVSHVGTFKVFHVVATSNCCAQIICTRYSQSNPPLLPFRRLGIFVLSIDVIVDSGV